MAVPNLEKGPQNLDRQNANCLTKAVYGTYEKTSVVGGRAFTAAGVMKSDFAVSAKRARRARCGESTIAESIEAVLLQSLMNGVSRHS